MVYLTTRKNRFGATVGSIYHWKYCSITEPPVKRVSGSAPELNIILHYKMKNKKCHTIETIPKSNIMLKSTRLEIIINTWSFRISRLCWCCIHCLCYCWLGWRQDVHVWSPRYIIKCVVALSFVSIESYFVITR